MDSSTHFYLTEDVFYYTEALVLFCNANVNIFFSCINNVCVRMFESACMRVWLCVCGLDRVGALGLCLNRPASFHPNPLSMISPTTQNTTRENTGIKPTSQGLTMNVLKYIDSPHWWCFDYTTCFLSGCAVKGKGDSLFAVKDNIGTVLPLCIILLATLLASCVPAPHTHVLYSICTVVSFIPCWVWSNDLYAVKPGHSLSSIQRLYQI